MLINMKVFSICCALVYLPVLNSCSGTSEPETMYEASDRYSDDFGIPANVKGIVLTNPIGFTYLNGNTDTAGIKYVIDRSVLAKSQTIANSEIKKIDMAHSFLNDSLYCNINYPQDLDNTYICNLNIDVPYRKNVIVKIPNQGIEASYMNSDLIIETEAWSSRITHHTGSLEVHSVDGGVTADLTIPVFGYCKCYMENGDISIKIPRTTSASVVLKTENGTISYTNLNISIAYSNDKELYGVLFASVDTIYLESKNGNIVLEGM